MFTVMVQVFRRHDLIDLLVQIIQRLVQTFQFAGQVFGQMAGDFHLGFMQNRHTDGQTFSENRTFEPGGSRPLKRAFRLFQRIK